MHTPIPPDTREEVAISPPVLTNFNPKTFQRISAALRIGSRNDVARPILEPSGNVLWGETKKHSTEVTRNKTESSDSARADYFMDMSHEIRTPISAIIGLATILLATKLDNKQMQCVSLLQGSAEALLALVNKTLNMSNAETGQVDLDLAPFNMAGLLRQIIDLMSTKAQEKQLRLNLSCNADTSTMFVGDSGLIRQIMINLVGNAIKFTDAGRVTISLDQNEIENGKKKISISVSDTGVGIPDNKINALFGRFVQVHSSFHRNYGGTGLGLAISKTLAENMGGTLGVTSVAGKGSTFTLKLQLPIQEGHADSGRLPYMKAAIS